MPNISQHQNSYLQIGEEQYPVICEIEEDAGSPAPQTKHGWSGTLQFGHDGNGAIPSNLLDADEALLLLEDGRQGRILFTSSRLTAGRRTKDGAGFVGRGQLK